MSPGASNFLYLKRKFINSFGLLLCCLAMFCGIFVLGAILWTLFSHGLPALGPHVFTQMTPAPGSQGGLLNAIFGSLAMTTLATVVGTPIGILAGTYLAEFGSKTYLASIVRFVNSILLSAPSVVIGFFIYAAVVATSGHFSGYAGALALSIILIPVVVNSTENMLQLVPQNLREAAAALGAPQWKVTMFITYRAAKSGILTGVLLGLARISGETAPLLFTSLNNQFWNANLAKPMANLPVVIFQFAMSPYEDWQRLAWAGALLITLTVLTLNITARFFLKSKTSLS
jgi:phosphate transport system permease protein